MALISFVDFKCDLMLVSLPSQAHKILQIFTSETEKKTHVLKFK